MKSDVLLKTVLDAGAFKAAVLRQSDIVLSAEFREICRKNSCGRYNRCWTCPPDAGDICELMDKVRSFSGAVLYQSVHALEDSYDYEGMMEAGSQHAHLSQRIETSLRASAKNGYLHLSLGGCHLCESCTKPEGKPCRFPEKALGSLEGFGIDVYRTCKTTPLKYINGQNTVTYFGMVLFSEQEDA